MSVRHNFIIRDLISNGYWSANHGAFKGIIFASQYNTRQDAETVYITEISKKISNHVEIVKHYCV